MNAISKQNVLDVANRLGYKPTNKQIDSILKDYQTEQNADPTATWNLVVENQLANLEVPQISNIDYKDKKYPSLSFTIDINGEPTEITIATESLSQAMGEGIHDGTEDAETHDVDSSIYYYVPNKVLKLNIEEIAEKHLDEAFLVVQ